MQLDHISRTLLFVVNESIRLLGISTYASTIF